MNVISLFTEGLSTIQSLVALFGILTVAAFASLMITKIGERILPKPKETRVCDFLPFKKLADDRSTIICKEGTLVRVIKVKGLDVTLVTPEQREEMLMIKKRMVDNLSEMGLTGRIISLRDMINLNDKPEYSIPLMQRIWQSWNYSLSRMYNNQHYLILSIKGRKNAEKDMHQATNAILAIMEPYEPRLMIESKDGEPEKSPFYPFARICSPVSKMTPKVGTLEGEELNSMLTSNYIHFTGDDGIIRFFGGDQDKLCIVYGIRAAGDYMDENLVADILSLDIELNVLHVFKPIKKAEVLASLEHQRRASFFTSFSSSAAQQYTQALEMVDSTGEDYQVLSEYSLVFFLFGRTKEELTFGREEIERITRMHGFNPVREGWAAQASFFAQFPTYEIYPRTYKYLSMVIGCAMCLEKSAEGNFKSDWGPGPIAIFKTITGTAYNWQFHITQEKAAVAHCVIIGPTGQGKTTLLAFLAGLAMRHQKLRVYFFDRHRGIEIFTKAIGGSYIKFDGDKNATTLNPFSCPDTSENRAFLRRWVRAITLATDATSEREISRAVTTAFEYLKPEERIMKNLYKSCFSPTGYMRRELFRWVNDEQYGRIFNASDDNLDMNTKFMAFDFTHIFEDETLAPAVISYIMHRIHTVAGATGEPSLIMIDETAPMLKHPMFRDNFIIGLQEGRKKRQAFLCAFQQPNIVDSLGLGEVVRGQCQTVIFFRNPQGMEEDYENWRLSKAEKDFIFGRSFTHIKYAILVSRPAIGESVILNVDLSGLGPLLKLYSSGRENVVLADNLMKEYGERNFVEPYLAVA